MDIKEIDIKYIQARKQFLEYKIKDRELIDKAIVFFNQYYNLVEHPFTLEDIDKLADIDFSLKMDFLHWSTTNSKTEEEINKFYRHTPFEFFKNLIKNMDVMHYQILGDNFIPELKRIEGKTVLDYGGGSGYLSILLYKLGYEVTFSEINKLSIEWMRYITKELNLNINVIDLQEEEIVNNYDMIIIKDVIEHLVNPEKILDKLSPKAKSLFIYPSKLEKEEDYLPMHFGYEIKNGKS